MKKILALSIPLIILLITSFFNTKGPCPFTLEVSENQIIDSKYFQKLLEFDTNTLNGHFDGSRSEFGKFVVLRLNQDEELKKLINYMKENDYRIVPGKYKFLDENWVFDDGSFIFAIDGKLKKTEVFKFEKSQQANNLDSVPSL